MLFRSDLKHKIGISAKLWGWYSKYLGVGKLRCVRGDSASPWFTLNVAFGIALACSWMEQTETVTRTVIYTSEDSLADIGAQLVYQ